MVVLIMGLPGSGKSFFASRLAEVLHADYISSDRLRRNMFTKITYSAQEKERVYDEMLLHMRQSLKHNKSVVVDATFYKNGIREKFRSEIGESGSMVFIEVIAPESLIKERLMQAREESDADFEIYKMIHAAWEPYEEKHLVLHSSNENIEIMLQEAINYLHSIKNEKGTDR
jgi:predicted kinase